MTTDIVARGSRQVEGFGTREIAVQSETATGAAEAQAVATEQAKYIVARRFPRDFDRVESSLLGECGRPMFALSARYARSVGKKKVDGAFVEQFAVGWSIRFAEAAMRALGNVEPISKTLMDTEDSRLLEFTVVDYETNVRLTKQVVIRKVVERSSKEGREVLGTRKNSKGYDTYIVRATEDEMLMKESALWSKFARNVLRFVPGDILDACESRVAATIAAMPMEDRIRAMLDHFSRMQVSRVDIEAYLGHAIIRKDAKGKDAYSVSAEELEDLRGIWARIKDGETSWKAVMQESEATGSAEESARVAEEKIAEMRSAPAPEAPVEAPPPPAPPVPSDAEMKEFDRQQAAEQAKDQPPKKGKLSL